MSHFEVNEDTNIGELLVHAEELADLRVLANAITTVLNNKTKPFDTMEIIDLHNLTLLLEPETNLQTPLVNLSRAIMSTAEKVGTSNPDTVDILSTIALNCLAFAHNSMGTPIAIRVGE